MNDPRLTTDADIDRAQLTRLREVLAELTGQPPTFGTQGPIAALHLASTVYPDQAGTFSLARGHAGDLANMVARGRQEHDAREEVHELTERVTAVVVAERRDRPGVDLSALIAVALWDAAGQLSGQATRVGRTPGGSWYLDSSVSDFHRGIGAARLVRGRPGSWEAELVLEWVAAGKGARAASSSRIDQDLEEPAVQGRLGVLTSLFIELGRRYVPVDGGDLLSTALGTATNEIGGLTRLVAGSTWALGPLERLAHQYAADGLAAGADLPSEQ
jgi:hypothetical protein